MNEFKEPKPTFSAETPERLKIERNAPEILTALAEAPIYKNSGQVHARLGIPGEKMSPN